MKSTPCRLCAQLPGCPLLGDESTFFWDKVIQENNSQKVCELWLPVGIQESKVRDKMYLHLGNGYIRGLHILPRDSLKDSKKEANDMIEVPDFAGMVHEGMTIEERTDQLLYETDNCNRFLVDQNGDRIPRGELPVRKYASSPKGPIGPPVCDTIAYWDFDKVLSAVLRAEKKLGWIAGTKKAKKTSAPMAQPEVENEKEEERRMPMKPRIIIRKGAATGKSAPAEEKDNTPAKVKGRVSKAATAKPKAVSVPDSDDEPKNQSGFEQDQVEKLIKDAIAPINKKLDMILKTMGQGPGKRSLADTVVDGLTVLHDALQVRASNLYFALIEDDGKSEVPFLDPSDGRDKQQCLLEGEPTNLISFYLDGESSQSEESEEESEEADEESEEGE
jgi:hypothetical protein